MDPAHLDLAHTLDCGQAFRWRRQGEGWVGVVGPRVFRLTTGGWQCWPEDDPDAETALHAYLRLGVDLAALQTELEALDPGIGSAFAAFPGLRVLAQPPRETLLTFICTPANNVVRITRSIDRLAQLYGEPLVEIDGEPHSAFPSAARLAATEPGELMRTCGLGFRGENLRQVAAELDVRSGEWPTELIHGPCRDARVELMTLRGIGPKVADCVCLFGLRHDEAVPVDTHVWALARELFSVELRTYEQVMSAYLARYGRWAGWAQQYLFHARRVSRDLPMPSEIELLRA